MINYCNMLDCVAAHLLAGQSERIHITDRQLATACETQTSLEVWASSKGLCVITGEFGGYSGFWLSVDKGGRA